MQGFQARRDRRKPHQKAKDEAALAALEAAEAAAEDGLLGPEASQSAEVTGPVLSELITDKDQLELWVAVGRALITVGRPQACQQLFEGGLIAFGR